MKDSVLDAGSIIVTKKTASFLKDIATNVKKMTIFFLHYSSFYYISLIF